MNKHPSLSELGAALLDTAGKATPRKPINTEPKKRDRTMASEVNRSSIRIERLKAYVQRESGWTMYWGGKTKGWLFKKGSKLKSRTSLEISKLSGDQLLAFLNKQ